MLIARQKNQKVGLSNLNRLKFLIVLVGKCIYLLYLRLFEKLYNTLLHFDYVALIILFTHIGLSIFTMQIRGNDIGSNIIKWYSPKFKRVPLTCTRSH